MASGDVRPSIEIGAGSGRVGLARGGMVRRGGVVEWFELGVLRHVHAPTRLSSSTRDDVICADTSGH